MPTIKSVIASDNSSLLHGFERLLELINVTNTSTFKEVAVIAMAPSITASKGFWLSGIVDVYDCWHVKVLLYGIV